jgi:hypothetical protein
MAFITLAKVKSYLGITDTTYDTAINTYIPIAESDLVRICNNNFNKIIAIDFASGSNTGTLQEFYPIEVYTVIQGTGILPDSYIIEYNEPDGEIMLNTNVTVDVEEMIYTIPLGVEPLLAQMVWFKVTRNNQAAATESKLKSKKVGPLSVTYSDAEINSKWDYPSKIIDSLPLYESVQ